MEGDQANELSSDTGYISMSTIDAPPAPIVEVVPNHDEAVKKAPLANMWKGERLFDIEFTVTLKPAEGKAIKVPLLVDTSIRGTLIEECMELALDDRRNVGIIQAILDNPKDRIQVGYVEEEPTKQSKLF